MARVRTDAAERTKQNKRLQTEVATELGQDTVTLKKAVEHRRKVKGVADIISRPIPLDDDTAIPIGVVLGAVADFRTVGGKTAHLSVTTNAIEFGHVLLDASMISHSELLVVALYKIDRKLGLDDDDDEVGGDSLPSGDED